MSVPETDLELLETWLDGELSPSEAEALSRRLEGEPGLRGALEALRGERALRAAVWSTCEPSELSVERLMGRVDRKITAWERRSDWVFRIRVASAAAACILVGWIGRGIFQPGVGPAPAPVPGATLVAENTGGPGPSVGGARVEVPFVDEYGRVVAVQHLPAEKAKEFYEDLRRWQQNQEQQIQGTAVSAEKF